MALFNNLSGLQMIHVPYNGAGPARVDIMAGYVPMMAGNILSSLPLVKSGRLRACGVTRARRSRASPAEFREFIRAEGRKWAKVIRDAKIEPE